MNSLVLTAAIVVLDQVTKLLVKGVSIPWLGISIEGMRYGESVPIIGDFFRLTYIENPGMAFGINFGGKTMFAVISIVASIAIVAYLYRSRHEPLGFRLSLAMILGGAIGNLIDRVFYGLVFHDAPLFQGRVVDFFDLDFFDIDILGYQLSRWPVFNIADASVTIGVVLLLLLHRNNASVSDSGSAVAPADPAPRGEPT